MRKTLFSLALAAFAFAAGFAFVAAESADASGCYEYRHYWEGNCQVTEVINTCTGCTSVQVMCPTFDFESYWC